MDWRHPIYSWSSYSSVNLNWRKKKKELGSQPKVEIMRMEEDSILWKDNNAKWVDGWCWISIHLSHIGFGILQGSWSKTYQYYLLNVLYSLRLYTDEVVFTLTIVPILKCDGLLTLKILFKGLSWPLPIHRIWQIFLNVNVYWNSSSLHFWVHALYFQSRHLHKVYARFFLYLSLDWV